MTYTFLIYLLLFLPGVVVVYGLLPRKLRGWLLLAASALFFFQMSKKLIVYPAATALITYFVGRWLGWRQAQGDARIKAGADRKTERQKTKRATRAILWVGVGTQLGVLAALKFWGAFADLVDRVGGSLPLLKLAMPLGISFYTLEAVSYLADVYYKKIQPERNFARMALFLTFFPTIMEGPICRYGDVAEPLWAGESLKYQNVAFGAQRILWGLFKKLVIADRLNPLVKLLFENHAQYGGAMVALGAALYTFQLYTDFSGCIDMTIGTGEIFGVTLPENFRQPFFAKTPSEFWRRWHITLGTWFKDYIFYPLSLTGGIKKLGKSARKTLGKHYGQIAQTLIPLFAVWVSNGVWHGVGGQFLFYGMYYFVLIVLGELVEPLVAKGTARLSIDRESWYWRILRTVKMLAIIFTGEMFFNAASLRVGCQMFASIFTRTGASALTAQNLLGLGIDGLDYAAVIVGLLVVLAVGVLHEKGVHIRERIAALPVAARWCVYLLAALTVLVFGAYGAGYTEADLIYAGF